MSTETKPQPGTFGNISKPGRSGILGLPLGVSFAGVPFIIIIVLMMTRQWFWQALIVALVGIVSAVLMVVTRKHGRSLYGRRMLKIAQRRKEKAGKHVYLAGPAGKTRDGRCRLPGLLAPSELSEHTDAYDNPFGLIRVVGQGVKNYSIVLIAHADGDELQAKERVDSMVAHWGAWLAQRGTDEGVRGAQVTVEIAPDSGLRLRRMMRRNHVDSAPEFSSQVAEAIESEYSHGSPQISTYISVTFDGRAIDGSGKDRGTAEMAEEIGNRLGMIIGGLSDTGAGTAVRAATAQDIIDYTRTAYDPTVAAQIEEARAEEGTGLDWEDAGPTFALDAFDHYRHDRAFSKSWTMYEGPRGLFYKESLRRAMEPPKDGMLRKRITMLYRPIPSDKTTNVVEQDINDAQFAGSQQRRVTARAKMRRAAAQKSADEEAAGAGVTRFGMIVTVSCADTSRFKQLEKRIPGLLTPARLKIREALGNQAVTFQAGLPLGLVVPDHMMLPDQLRDWM
jgi:hypothetical protein